MSILTDSWDDISKFFGINGTTADVAGMTLGQTSVATSAATLKNAGTVLSIFGGINSAVGQYYAAKSQQYQVQSEASTLQFQSGMDAINAHGAEMAAQSVLEAGKTETEQYTMKAGQEAASSQVQTAAQGVDLSSGSAVANRASQDLTKQIDVMTINANATRQAWADRTQATNDKNQGLLAGVSANNLRTSANSISPVSASTTSLLNSATSVASQWDYRRRVALATGFSTPMGFGTMASLPGS